MARPPHSEPSPAKAPALPLDSRGRPLHDLRISVTDRCNFRCPYCMPAEVFGENYKFLPRKEILTFEEVTRLARLFVKVGVSKIRITGGEPLLRADLPDLVASLRDIDGIEDLTLTTNGLLLPKFATALKAAGLNRITVSMDSLDPEVFREMAGRNVHPDQVLEGIAAAEAAGLSPIKINCVVERGKNEGGVLSLAQHFRGTPHILRFIEFMDVGTLNGWSLDRVVGAKEIVEAIHAQYPLKALTPQYPGEVAKRYAYEDGSGEIGMIASVTQPFCGSCSRGRLSTQGDFVTCLFADKGLDLRAPLRAGASDAELLSIIGNCWKARDDRYSELRTEETAANAANRIEMFRMGG